MPELPEVEVCRRGLQPEIEGERILGAVVRAPRLRLPLSPTLDATLAGLGTFACCGSFLQGRGKRVLLAVVKWRWVIVGHGVLRHVLIHSRTASSRKVQRRPLPCAPALICNWLPCTRAISSAIARPRPLPSPGVPGTR